MEYEIYDETYDTDIYVDVGEEYYDQAYIEHEYWHQQVSPSLIFLAIAGVVISLILVFSWVDISSPTTSEANINPRESSGLGGRGIAPLFTPEVQYWSASIVKWSQQTGIDPNLIATVMQIESCGDPNAKSSAGAMGLFQVMPYHFESGEDPYKPATNARRGLGYLEQALTTRGGVARLGLAGYNGGISGAKRPESQWANETQRYVYWGTGIYKDAIKGKDHSTRLDEWLGRGGASLCNQAAQRLGINPQR